MKRESFEENGPVPDRRGLRSQYRALHCQARDSKEALGNLNTNTFEDYLTRVEKLRQRVEKPREHAVDSEVFCQLAECAVDMAKRARQTNQGHTPADLIVALRANYVQHVDPQHQGASNPAAFDWHALGHDVAHLCRWAPGVGCMLGPLDAEHKARRVPVQRRQRAQLAAVVAPEQVDLQVEEDKQETDRNMEEMWEVITGMPNWCCPMVDLICNYDSFAQTVENMFTLAFLVRDQRVRLQQDDQRGLLVRALKPNEIKDDPMHQVPLQVVVSFTMDDWQVMRRVVGKRSCLMRHRAPVLLRQPEAASAQ